jgi:hypothetical protein
MRIRDVLSSDGLRSQKKIVSDEESHLGESVCIGGACLADGTIGMRGRSAPVLVESGLGFVFSVARLTYNDVFCFYVLQKGHRNPVKSWDNTRRNKLNKRTWSRAAVSLNTLLHVGHNGWRVLVCRAWSRSASALENVRLQAGNGQREAGQEIIAVCPPLFWLTVVVDI